MENLFWIAGLMGAVLVLLAVQVHVEFVVDPSVREPRHG